MANTFAWVELTTHNLGGARKFYSEVFDWKLSDVPMPGMEYTTIDTGEQPGGGMMTIPEPGVPTAWTVYVRVDDINGACEKVGKNGGKVWKGPMEVPEVGWIAIVCDPQGAYFGLWQPAANK